MSERIEAIERRKFLVKSASFILGSLFGFNGFSRALACGTLGTGAFFRPRIALIIDDIGFSFSRARRFLDLGVPMTYAILPRLPHSRELAWRIHDQGQEVMLHQPMEPYDHRLDPGPGALFVGDGMGKIEKTMTENISETPFVTGVNNHMGSKFTSCRKEIRQTLEVVKERGLFFVDSLTSSRSMGYSTAKRLQVETACRNIFVDNQPHIPLILSQLRRLKRHALKYGRAIGIGHPLRETAEAVGLFAGDLSDSGISLAHVSDLVLS